MSTDLLPVRSELYSYAPCNASLGSGKTFFNWYRLEALISPVPMMPFVAVRGGSNDGDFMICLLLVCRLVVGLGLPFCNPLIG